MPELRVQPSLFETNPSFPRAQLAATIERLGKQSIFIGTSSWRYEGWLGQIYTPERYFSRVRFSKTKFQRECIEEYAEVFPIVCGENGGSRAQLSISRCPGR